MSIRLLSSDNIEFHVSKEVAIQSMLIKNMGAYFIYFINSSNCFPWKIDEKLEDVGDEQSHPIPLQNVTAQILQKVIDYAEYHKNDVAVVDDDLLTPKNSTIILDW